MSLQETLYEDMKKAMKQRDAGKNRLSVIRLAQASLKNAEIEKGDELTDQEIVTVLSREVKQRPEAILEYQKAGRDDTVIDLKAEIEILMEYLPKQLTEEEIRVLVQEEIERLNARGTKDLGLVMRSLMPKVQGKADGKLVNLLVKETLLN